MCFEAEENSEEAIHLIVAAVASKQHPIIVLHGRNGSSNAQQQIPIPGLHEVLSFLVKQFDNTGLLTASGRQYPQLTYHLMDFLWGSTHLCVGS